MEVLWRHCQYNIMKNIYELRGYNNLKNSGQALIIDFIGNLLNCQVALQQLPIAEFEKRFNIDITTNINRNCYTVDERTRCLKIKVYSEGEVLAIMPVLLAGENVKSISNRYLEDLAVVLSKQMTICYYNSFRGGTVFFGEQLEKLVVGTCICAKHYDYTRIIYLIELLEKLSATTFEGENFSTGFILSRSLYEYKGKRRNGELIPLNNEYDIVRTPEIDKRLWYIIDGKDSFYIMDQKLLISNVFIRNHSAESWEEYFDSHLMAGTLLGDDIAFRTSGPNAISIVNSIGIEFIKIENKWRLRNFQSLNTYFKRILQLDEKVRRAIIYYVIMCSRKHSSSIIWIPEESDEISIDKVIGKKTSLFKRSLNVTDQTHAGIIYRVLSSDGVTIIDKKGNLIYCGGIVRLAIDASEGLMGTGETAAKTLSSNGLAIKISQDGNIKIFSDPKHEPLVY